MKKIISGSFGKCSISIPPVIVYVSALVTLAKMPVFMQGISNLVL